MLLNPKIQTENITGSKKKLKENCSSRSSELGREMRNGEVENNKHKLTVGNCHEHSQDLNTLLIQYAVVLHAN